MIKAPPSEQYDGDRPVILASALCALPLLGSVISQAGIRRISRLISTSLRFARASAIFCRMARPPKSDVSGKAPRPSRTRSGKPLPPPTETQAGTPSTRASDAPSSRASDAPSSRASDATSLRCFGEMPQAQFDATGPLLSTPSITEKRATLPALRQSGPRPPVGSGESISDGLNALLAKPGERSERANEVLARQPMMATHPLVSGLAAVHAAPAAAPGEERGRHRVQDRLRVRAEGRPAARDRRTGGGRRGSTSTDQVLLGVTGSGKTFTMANVIAATQRPALVLAPNKTLAAQLYGEFKSFFPDNAVEYFVSYYDYYQPEAYVPRTDTYIEKDASINEQIDRMRHSATRALLERDDVHHRRLGVVHLRHRLGRDLHGDDVHACRWASACRATSCCADLVGSAVPAQRHRLSCAAPSACAATPSRCSRPTWRTAPGASRCSATRSRASPSSIR